jgi:ribosomal protein S6
MPAAEANEAEALEVERASYELAFHVLPTVADGEVTSVFEAVKALIMKDGGEIFDEEAPERFELAYEVIKHLEGKNRRFMSAYFGWVRFKIAPEAVDRLLEEVEGNGNILRHLLIKLTRVEEENPFYFHKALVKERPVVTIDEAALAEAPAAAEEGSEAAPDEALLEEALENKEV